MYSGHVKPEMLSNELNLGLATVVPNVPTSDDIKASISRQRWSHCSRFKAEATPRQGIDFKTKAKQSLQRGKTTQCQC